MVVSDENDAHSDEKILEVSVVREEVVNRALHNHVVQKDDLDVIVFVQQQAASVDNHSMQAVPFRRSSEIVADEPTKLD